MSLGPSFDETTQNNINAWLNGEHDPESKAQIKKTLQENPEELIDAFLYRPFFWHRRLKGCYGGWNESH